MEGVRNVLKATFLTVVVASAIALIGCVNPVAVSKSPATEKPAVAAETAPLVRTTSVIDKDNYLLKFPLPESSGGNASIVDGRSLVNYEDTGGAFQDAINYYQLLLVDDKAKDNIWTSAISMPSSLNLAAATTATATAYTSPRSGSDVARPSQAKPSTDSTGKTTTGTLTYAGFTSLGLDDAPIDSAKYGKFSFGLSYVPFGITDAAIWQAAFGDSLTAAPQWKIGGDVYLTYRLYGKDAAYGGLPAGVVAAPPTNAPAGVPAGLSWKTASADPETFLLASDAHDQVPAEYREIWLDATAHDTARTGGETLLDKTLAAKPDAGKAKYVISVPVNANANVPSMKLLASGTSDYTIGDNAKDSMTFAKLDALQTPLSITITGPSTGSTGSPTGAAQPVLALSEQGSMFWLDTLGVPVTVTIDNVTLRGLSAAGHSIPAIDNNQALVYVGTGNTFEMKGSAELTGNYNAGISRYQNGGLIRIRSIV